MKVGRLRTGCEVTGCRAGKIKTEKRGHLDRVAQARFKNRATRGGAVLGKGTLRRGNRAILDYNVKGALNLIMENSSGGGSEWNFLGKEGWYTRKEKGGGETKQEMEGRVL